MIIPLFIISFNRLSVLKQCIESYKKLGDRIQIIIHDNDSTYQPLLDYYKDCGYTIYHNKSKGDMYDISLSVKKTIDKWYSENRDLDAPYYIVTDPDIELEQPSPELLDYYIKVMQKHNPPCVGPMLRIDDIPDCFKFKETMVKSHNEQFWHRENQLFENVKIQRAGIDTTFALYRKNFSFNRLNYGMRVHEPYMARHLDWYQDSDNLNEEEQYYRDHASNVSTLSTYNKQGFMG